MLLGSLLLVSLVNWLLIYLALKLQALSILMAIMKNRAYNTEAGLKYFVLGAVSSGLLCA